MALRDTSTKLSAASRLSRVLLLHRVRTKFKVWIYKPQDSTLRRLTYLYDPKMGGYHDADSRLACSSPEQEDGCRAECSCCHGSIAHSATKIGESSAIRLFLRGNAGDILVSRWMSFLGTQGSVSRAEPQAQGLCCLWRHSDHQRGHRTSKRKRPR